MRKNLNSMKKVDPVGHNIVGKLAKWVTCSKKFTFSCCNENLNLIFPRSISILSSIDWSRDAIFTHQDNIWSTKGQSSRQQKSRPETSQTFSSLYPPCCLHYEHQLQSQTKLLMQIIFNIVLSLNSKLTWDSSLLHLSLLLILIPLLKIHSEKKPLSTVQKPVYFPYQCIWYKTRI